MKRLLIIGAGGFGREVLAWALDIPKEKRDWELAGFLDSNPFALKDYACPYPVIDDDLNFPLMPDDLVICAIGDPSIKLRVCNTLKKQGANFITLIHPSAIIGPRCTIGDGCVLCPGVVITTDATIGDFVTLNVYATVGHDASIGDGSTISGHCDVTGFAKVGKSVFLGTHAVILPGAVVGDNAVVGAGSVVLKKVAPNSTVMGVPAKKII